MTAAAGVKITTYLHSAYYDFLSFEKIMFCALCPPNLGHFFIYVTGNVWNCLLAKQPINNAIAGKQVAAVQIAIWEAMIAKVKI